jgi:hypothetical protein
VAVARTLLLAEVQVLAMEATAVEVERAPGVAAPVLVVVLGEVRPVSSR